MFVVWGAVSGYHAHSDSKHDRYWFYFKSIMKQLAKETSVLLRQVPCILSSRYLRIPMCYILYTSTLCGHTLAPVVAHHRDVDSLLACWWLPVATLDVLSLATNMTVRTQQLVFYEPIFAGIEV